MEGTAFGRYQLIELLGRGGMGEVWRAHDTAIDREVAIKTLLPHYAQDPDFTERFRREARAAARLDDPHIVPIYDVGEIDGRLYVMMRLISGRDLLSLLSAGPLEPARAVRIVEQIASALHHAHQEGLVHRDVKPSNILVGENDFAYLIDFGIARSAGDSALTSASSAVGTWAYMAPERFSTGDIAPSSDVYALACVLYQCLTGGVPFPGDTLEQVAGAHMVVPPPRPSHGHVAIPTALDDVVAVGLAKRPADRYPTTVDLASAAQRAITAPIARPDPAYAQTWSPSGGPAATDPPTVVAGRSRRRTAILIGALLAVTALIAGGVFIAARPSEESRTTTATEQSAALPAPTPTGPPPNTGPLTGLYRADFGPITHLNDVPGPDPSKASDRFAIRSTCLPTGCVANATRLEGTVAYAKPFVLDRIGDRWFAVGLSAVPCKTDQATEAWEVMSLRPQPDGRLAGEFMSLTGNDCLMKRTVTLTRTGDVDVESLPDPASLAPRVRSPAEGLWGEYLQTRTFPRVGQQQQATYRVNTHCVRTGDRCISFMWGPNGEANPLVFDKDAWALFTETDVVCRGATMHVKKTGRYPLPAPAQTPIPELNGSGRQDQSAPCAAEVEFTETMTRTGD
ncbi:serine/threonine-protein kinase [Mycolicibacterium arenosum]|uniref:non-specific serine/threonine protein kinase n=1 Tax=Mycolicibacterium arenosum TaxID=2952157 RepID=A0ABT1M5W0_9MYCO|nr:serine/threonine protein kinase [Mycolicibacterium sp. CAU 1645]